MNVVDQLEEAVRLTTYRDVSEGLLPRPKDALKQASYDEGAEVYEGVLISLDGDPHHRRRRLEMPLFTKSLFKQYEGELFPELTQRAFDEIGSTGSADLVQFAHIVTVQFASRVTGLDRHETAEDALTLYRLLMKLNEGATVAWSTRPHDEVFREVRTAREKFVSDFFAPALERRRDLLLAQGSLPPTDLISVILMNADDDPLSDAQIMREATLYGIASAHTSATALVHAFHELFKWLEEHPKDSVKSEDLDFLQRVVYETLRLHPSSPAQRRHVHRDMTLSSGTELHEGQLVVLDLGAAGRDPEVFGEDADQFLPDRSVPENVSRYGLTFGGGPHACIGRDLAAGSPHRQSDEADEDQAFGTITRMLKALLDHGARPDPDAAPVRDSDTKRELYSSYPILLSAESGA